MAHGSYAVRAAFVMLAFSAAPTWASRPLPGISGTVTSVSGSQVVIDGHAYSVRLDGPALGELAQIHPGQQVDVVLNGPPGAAGTQVVDIHAHR
jgi:hypothetical protein